MVQNRDLNLIEHLTQQTQNSRGSGSEYFIESNLPYGCNKFYSIKSWHTLPRVIDITAQRRSAHTVAVSQGLWVDPGLRLLSVWCFTCHPYVHVGFLQVLRFPPLYIDMHCRHICMHARTNTHQFKVI